MSRLSSEVLDLFAGPGGWGKHRGIEIADDVVATRLAAGLPTIQADVAMTNPSVVPTPRGIVASAPCPPFSTSGTGRGREDLELVSSLMESVALGRDSRRKVMKKCKDPRSVLSVEPLRWVLHHMPEWTAWEQVVGARPLWDLAAQILTDRGYNVWVGYLDAEDYGVAQTRKRAILMAHRTKLVSKPSVRPIAVTMREALDWKGPDLILKMGRSRGTQRHLDQPAPTIMFGKSPSGVAWYDDAGQMVRPLEIEEALVLQGFPSDYPLQGGKVSRYRQIGDAIPRGMADAIIESLEA